MIEATMWGWAMEHPYLFTLAVCMIAAFFRPILISVETYNTQSGSKKAQEGVGNDI